MSLTGEWIYDFARKQYDYRTSDGEIALSFAAETINSVPAVDRADFVSRMQQVRKLRYVRESVIVELYNCREQTIGLISGNGVLRRAKGFSELPERRNGPIDPSTANPNALLHTTRPALS